ncbi:hypothetical protein M8J77_000563 [Diaphorina citri]|nr:hypothetical protein M8J77_000563 [Diaphorina citri]
MIGSNLSVVIDKKCVTIQKKLEPTNDDFGKTTCSEENTHESLNPSEIELLASSCQTSKREILPRNPTSGVQCKNISTRPATDTIISTTPTTPAGATSSSSQDYTIIELQSLAEFSPQPNTPSTSECKSATKKCPKKLFFTVPSNEALKTKWCAMMNRKDIIKGKSKYICEDHFEFSQRQQNSDLTDAISVKEEAVKSHPKLRNLNCDNEIDVPLWCYIAQAEHRIDLESKSRH